MFVCVYVCALVRLSVQKTKRGPVRRLCVGLPVSTQSGPQWRICRPDRIKPPSLHTTVMRIRSLQSSGDSKDPLIHTAAENTQMSTLNSRVHFLHVWVSTGQLCAVEQSLDAPVISSIYLLQIYSYI